VNRRPLLLAAALALAALAAAGLYAPPGPRSMRSFDPARVADLELAMWQAYYRKEKLRLGVLLVATLREQFRYSWLTATRAAYHLARAAAVFGDLRGDYERVLPDLERGYAIARDWTGAAFDPGVVARDELAWWVARRDQSTSDPHHVGALMAQLYADFYGVPRARVAGAALLRAQAGALRDHGGLGADWRGVGALLHESYQSLDAALRAGPLAAARKLAR
jgi:hypothetical protein